jgi:hypothetical protein
MRPFTGAQLARCRADHPGTMLRSRQLLFAVAASCAIAAYPLWPDGSLLESCWFAAVGLGCAATMVIATHGRDVPAAAAWRWFALGMS